MKHDRRSSSTGDGAPSTDIVRALGGSQASLGQCRRRDGDPAEYFQRPPGRVHLPAREPRLKSTRCSELCRGAVERHDELRSSSSRQSPSSRTLLCREASESTDEAVAASVLQSVGTSAFGTDFLNSLVTAEQSRVTAANQELSTTTNTAIEQAIQPEVANDNDVIQQAQSLLTNIRFRFDQRFRLGQREWIGSRVDVAGPGRAAPAPLAPARPARRAPAAPARRAPAAPVPRAPARPAASGSGRTSTSGSGRDQHLWLRLD